MTFYATKIGMTRSLNGAITELSSLSSYRVPTSAHPRPVPVEDLQRRADAVLAQVPVLLRAVAGQQLRQLGHVHIVVVVKVTEPPGT